MRFWRGLFVPTCSVGEVDVVELVAAGAGDDQIVGPRPTGRVNLDEATSLVGRSAQQVTAIELDREGIGGRLTLAERVRCRRVTLEGVAESPVLADGRGRDGRTVLGRVVTGRQITGGVTFGGRARGSRDRRHRALRQRCDRRRAAVG